MKTKHKSHAYIIASRDIEARERNANSLAQSIVCDRGGDTPCGSCSQCVRAGRGVHPDIIYIERLKDDKGKLKREISVEQIRNMSADALVVPQQAEYKVYVIREASLMNISAQNAALKILEEPPAYAVFILCTDNAEELLPTVRSRCVVHRVGERIALSENASAQELISAAISGDEAELLRLCSKLESLDSAACSELVDACRKSLAEKICRAAAAKGLSAYRERNLLELFDRLAEFSAVNVSTKHIMGYIAVSAI